jgi:hypothetical protein
MSSGKEISWRELQEKVNQNMQQWRKEHPKATLKEIEIALDQQMGMLRARMLEKLATDSPSAQPSSEEGAACSNCETPLQNRGKKKTTTNHAAGSNGGNRTQL